MADRHSYANGDATMRIDPTGHRRYAGENRAWGCYGQHEDN